MPQYINKTNYNERLFQILKYKIISDNNLSCYQTVDEGIENRIMKFIHQSNSIDELISNIKTKRYTYNKISRMLVHILCSFTKDLAEEMGYCREVKEYKANPDAFKGMISDVAGAVAGYSLNLLTWGNDEENFCPWVF